MPICELSPTSENCHTIFFATHIPPSTYNAPLPIHLSTIKIKVHVPQQHPDQYKPSKNKNIASSFLGFRSTRNGPNSRVWGEVESTRTRTRARSLIAILRGNKFSHYKGRVPTSNSGNAGLPGPTSSNTARLQCRPRRRRRLSSTPA